MSKKGRGFLLLEGGILRHVEVKATVFLEKMSFRQLEI